MQTKSIPVDCVTHFFLDSGHLLYKIIQPKGDGFDWILNPTLDADQLWLFKGENPWKNPAAPTLQHIVSSNRFETQHKIQIGLTC